MPSERGFEAPRARFLLLLLLCGLGCRGERTVERAGAPAAAVSTPGCVGSSSLGFTVQAGEYIHAVAGQQARDAVLTLFEAGGRPLLRVDSLTLARVPPWLPEEIHWVADAPGELHIELAVPGGGGGPCDLRLVERRPATAVDRRRAEAEAELARAHGERLTRQAEPCRAGVASYEAAQGGFASLGLPRRRAEALLGLGRLQSECLHESRAAFQTFTRAEPLFAADPDFEAVIRQYRGELRYGFGDLDGAIAEYRRALELRRQLGDPAREAVTASSLGLALQVRGRYDEAAIQFDRALALWTSADDPGERAKTLLHRGHLHRQLEEWDQARERYGAALALFREAKDRNNEAATLNGLGLLALDAGRPGEALESLPAALALRSPGSRGYAVTQTAFGVAYRQLGRLEDARRAYAEALPIFQRLGDLREQARILDSLGRLEATAGHDTAALTDFDRAAKLFRTLADPPAMALAWEGKARVLRHHGDLEAASRLMSDALETVERHRFSQTSYATRAAFFATQQSFYDFLIDLLMDMDRKAPSAGHAAAALKVSEQSLARSLLDGLAAGGTRFGHRGAAPELHAQEKELESEIARQVSRETSLAEGATRETGNASLLRPVEAELERLWGQLDRVRAELRAGDPRYAALTQPQPWSAAEIQRELLDRDTLLLEYRLGEARSYLWAVTPDSLESFALPGRAEIQRLAGQAYDLLARSHGRNAAGSLGRPLAELSRLLFGPVASHLPGKRLLVVGDGILQRLPFAALTEPGADGVPLIARHEIVSLPSASVLGELRRETAGRAAAPKSLWVLADPDFGGRFPPLPYTRQEAAAILALAPGGVALRGREANRAAVLNGGLRDFRLLHFATHGSFDATDAGGGRLVLAQVDPRGRREGNGFLHLADIYELDLRADLVVLSTCRSALGREVRGEGMMGMTRGFFYAGAERVLVSLWNVDDRTTVDLMQRFYRGILVEGLSPAAALRVAQNAVRREERSRAPYYWAGFTLQGEWR